MGKFYMVTSLQNLIKHMNIIPLQTFVHAYFIKCIEYRKRGKFRWAKLSRFWPYEVFRGNTFAVHWSGM